MMTSGLCTSGSQPFRGEPVFRVLVVLGLALDAAVHLRLASDYQPAAASGIGEGNVFRIQSAVAIAVAWWLLLRGSRAAYLAAALVGLSAAAAVVFYRYVDIGGFGPIPPMYEPTWSSDKRISAVAEGLAGALALCAAYGLSDKARHAPPVSSPTSLPNTKTNHQKDVA